MNTPAIPLLRITLARGDTWTFTAEYDEAEVSVYSLHTYGTSERRGLIGRAADMSEALDAALEFADELYVIDWEDAYADRYGTSEWAGAQEGRV